MIDMFDDEQEEKISPQTGRQAPPKAAPQQTWLQWLTGQQPETPDEAAEKKKKADQDARTRAGIQQAIKGVGTLKKVVNDSAAANKTAAGTTPSDKK